MISAEIIADSYNESMDSRITTFELQYPRFIHAELMTHRVFSRNAASSRAIPIEKVIDMVRDNPAMPIHWGKNQAGMQAKEEIADRDSAIALWIEAAKSAASFAVVMKDIGLHKQVVNRILEPYQLMKTVVTSTKFNNWFWLRDHEDAQPEIKELAAKMQDAMRNSPVKALHKDEWHVPYVNTAREIGILNYYNENGDLIDSLQARKISASCCAQVSYRKNDPSVDKAEKVFDRLINSEPIHASPIEHQATPIINDVKYFDEYFLKPGVTAIDELRMPYSGNFHGWIQYRQLIENNSKEY
jgi:hypothetical protein